MSRTRGPRAIQTTSNRYHRSSVVGPLTADMDAVLRRGRAEKEKLSFL
jgi:hypothetical protein